MGLRHDAVEALLKIWLGIEDGNDYTYQLILGMHVPELLFRGSLCGASLSYHRNNVQYH